MEKRYKCLGLEFASLGDLEMYFEGQWLDGAVNAAGAVVYADGVPYGYLRISYDLFGGDVEVSVIHSPL